jgi:aerobic carbon-monoxide dehydrogenase large subunit
MHVESHVSGRTLVGSSQRRMEDHRLLIGAGQYLDDLIVPNLAEVALLHSTYAHARIGTINAEVARAMPGVIAVITADDLGDVGGVPVAGNLKISEHPPLAKGIVRFAGEPIAAVVATDRYLARDAIDAIEVDYEPLPAVVDAVAALDPEAPILHPEFGTNATLTAASTFGEPDAEFAAAECRLTVHVGHGRVAALPIETRGGIAAFDAETGKYTLWLSTQAAWSERTDLAKALGIPEDDLHVITPDVGGAFGGKMTAYRETILLLALARIAGCPVRWVASRTEDLQTSMHGREAVTDGEVAFDRDGRIRALRLRTVANFGAYLMKYSGGPPMRMVLFPTGAYTIRHVHSEVVGVFTNTGPMGPYRGAGRPEAAYFIERVMSDVAHYLGMDQAEIRRKNFIPSTAFPYTNAANIVYDSGDYARALDQALANLDIGRVQSELAERRVRGEVVGIGIASCVEVSGGGGEGGTVTLHPDGRVTAITGTSPHGQGLATSFAQIIGDTLGVPMDAIAITHGDTALGTRGGGTMGSRSLQLGGNALLQAARDVRERIVRAAAMLLEVEPSDLMIHEGTIGPSGVPGRALPLGEVIAAAREMAIADGEELAAADGLSVTTQFQSAGESFPFGTAIAVVSIDRDTGRPTIERFVAVDDCGNVINPLLVEGQLIGGATQGIGETLWERIVYDANGQLLTGSLMDYAAPRAEQLPFFEMDRTVTPSPRNPLGAKGVGEAGTVSAPPAVANAVMDALRPFGVEPLDLPLTDEKLWRVIHDGGKGIR